MVLQTTLVKQYKKIDSDINKPEYDVILSTGEQYSSALISTFLNKNGVKISFNSWVANSNNNR